MVKQVIVANKSLNMSAGKLAAMVSHGSGAFMVDWIKKNITNNPYCSGECEVHGCFSRNIIQNWMNEPTKIVLEAENEEQMKDIIKKAKEQYMVNGVDYFNIVDESTEFHDIPTWAVIAFKPMDADDIDKVTGNLSLYGYGDN